ncbi:serine/threonine-protein kinase [Kitasatospora sp. NBC_01302]|uniref:serine/threonine-protein kinase n=1 Tax=Kitasatospora sp. NBC_01302 TaxID=2903575 RepID=UPI002E0D5CAA|nr:serine/threonine protein kinase [Kitasatospora sp. NBC_01302]
MSAGMSVDGRYRLEQRLGQGGMGEVWRAHDPALDRPVAIKFLSRQVAVDGELLERFRREARVTARFQHPGITQVFETGSHNGQLYLVMELLDGRDLGALLKEQASPMPVEQAVDLAAQVADALAYAHRKDIVHRDIKPANLMLVEGGRVKVCDFGIAGYIRADSDLTRTGRLIGTPAYMAPEQCEGRRVDGRADLYALGCVLFALLTGQPPFSSLGSYPAVLVAHLRTPPPLLSERRTRVPDALQRIVSALLAKDPAARPGDAGAVAEQLRRVGRPGAGGAVLAALPDLAAPQVVPAPRPIPPAVGEPGRPSAPAGSGIELEVCQNEYLPPEAVTADAIVTVRGTDADPPDPAAAAPRSLVLLLGLSTGLPEADFRAVRRAVAEAIDALDEGVAFAVVAGSQYARMLYPDSMRLVPATAATKAEARAALERLEPMAAAAFGRWLRLADRLFAAHADTVRTAILLTDVDAAAERPQELAAALTATAGRFACHARGIGTAWSVAQLRSVTGALSGTLGIVAEPAAPTDLLAHELASIIDSTRHAFARNLALRIRMPATVRLRFLKQVAPLLEDLTARGEPVGPGTFEYPIDVPGNGSSDYHLSLAVPPGRVGDTMRAAELRVVLLPPAGDGQTLARQAVLVTRTDDAWAETGRPARSAGQEVRHTGQEDLARAIQEALAARRDGGESQAPPRH